MMRKCCRAGRLALGLTSFLCFGLATLQARPIHVLAGAAPPGNGSQDQPYPTIQAAADVAVAGDTVLVHGGTYYETVKPAHSGQDLGGIIRYVYFVAAGDGPAIVKAQQNFCFVIGELDSIGGAHYVDYIWIEGFYLTNGYGSSTAHGSGIRTFSNDGVFINNKIYDNDVGVFCEGNGTYAESGNNRGNYIAHNVISNSGEAAVRMKHSSENDVVFNLIYHNGFRIEPSAAVTFYCGLDNRIINNTMWDNAGGAVHAYDGTQADSCIGSAGSDVRDNIFARPDPGILLRVDSKTAYNPLPSDYIYNLFWSQPGDAVLILWGANNMAQNGHLMTLPQFMAMADTSVSDFAQGCFLADPLFANSGSLNFDLMPASPALNQGSRLAIDSPDSLGGSRPPPDSIWASMLTVTNLSPLDTTDFGTVDIGYHHPYLGYSTNPPLWISPGISLYPNPYSGSGGVFFMLPNVPYARKIYGKVYNLRGQKVAEFRLPDNALNTLEIHWNASDLAHGRYFVELNIDGRKVIEPITLVK